MGGVDLLNQFVSTFIVPIMSKKWWWPFFAWAVNVSMAIAWNLFCIVQKQNISMLEFQSEVIVTIQAYFEEISLQSHWRFHEILQALWSLIPKITSLWKAHQNFVVVTVDQSIYARNAMLPYTLTLSRAIIHETQNCFLADVLVM